MFNRSVYFGGSDTNIKVNAVSGGIVKNHANSYFLNFHLDSKLSKGLLSQVPHVRRLEYPYGIDRYVEVLQMVMVGDMEVVAEVIDLEVKSGKA